MDRIQIRQRVLGVYYRRLGLLDALITTVFYLAFAITDIVILALDWNNECKYQLRNWLLMVLIVNTAKYILYWVDRLNEFRIKSTCGYFFFNVIGIILLFNGIYYLTTPSDCHYYAQNMYRLVFAHTMFDTVVYVMYTGLLLFTLCWAPTIIRIMEYMPIPYQIEEEDRGLSQEQLDNLEHGVYERVLTEEEPVCGICLGNYTDGVEVRTLGCQHMYHKDCCDTWLKINSTCPMCRVEVVVDQTV